jgi:hypothetical protein
MDFGGQHQRVQLHRSNEGGILAVLMNCVCVGYPLVITSSEFGASQVADESHKNIASAYNSAVRIIQEL